MILSETMIFPYLRGLVYCAHLTNKGGWEALDAAYKSPPRSTEQVIHPEKYRDEPDPPTELKLDPLPELCGWKEMGKNVVGEMQIGVMLRRFDRKAAPGWDGDRYVVFVNQDDMEKLGLVWISTWDTERDAGEFAHAYTRFQTSKLGPDAETPDQVPDRLRRSSKNRVYAVERRGLDVAVVEGFDPESSERLVDAAFRVTRTELK